MGNEIITAALLTEAVSKMKYAVVQKRGGDNVFIKASGHKGNISDLTVSGFRAAYNNEPNSIVYVKDDSLEVLINLPNGFCVHGISDVDSGRNYLEVAIRYGGKVNLDTPLTGSVIHKVDTDEILNIVNHVSNLDASGTMYVQGFQPNTRYTRWGIVNGVISWIRRKSK